MGAHQRYTRNPPPPTPQPTTRALWREAKYLLLQWEHLQERLQEQARLVLAGEKSDIRHIERLEEARDKWYAELRPILIELAKRTRLHKKNRLPHDIADHDYLSTAAQKIAQAATKRDFNLLP